MVIKKFNRLESAQKFIQVGIDVTCMHTNFGWRGLSGFGAMASFCLPSKKPKFPFGPWAIVYGGQKIESAQKIYASRSWCEMHANQFWWGWSLQFRSYGFLLLAFKNGQNFPSNHGLYSPWSSKNLIDRNLLKKFKQVGIDVTCMHTNFGWRGLSGFGVMVSFCLPSKMAKISLRTMDYSP